MSLVVYSEILKEKQPFRNCEYYMPRVILLFKPYQRNLNQCIYFLLNVPINIDSTYLFKSSYQE